MTTYRPIIDQHQPGIVKGYERMTELTLDYPPSVNHYWRRVGNDEFSAFYVNNGKKATAIHFGTTEAAVRARASRLGLRINRNSKHFQEWQARAANSKRGKKRPEQAVVMKRLLAAGKMKITDSGRRAISEKTKERLAFSGHPRGAKGMKHTEEVKRLIGQKSKAAFANRTQEQEAHRITKQLKTRAMNGTLAPNRKRGTWKAAWRVIGGIRKFYRSKWEANYARVLQWLVENGQIAKWEHEAETFWFHKIKRGCRSYLPDFRVTNNDGTVEYHEVKGWMDKRSKTKLKRMAKYYPRVKMVVIDKKQYTSIRATLASSVHGWE